MRLSILALALALVPVAACSSEPSRPLPVVAESPTSSLSPVPSQSPAPSPTRDIPLALQPIRFDDAERAGMTGAGCAWSERARGEPSFIAHQGMGAMKVGGRLVMLEADPDSPPLDFGVRRRFVGEGIGAVLEPTGPNRRSGDETVSRPATLSIGADGIDMTPKPGVLSCGS